MPQRLHGPQTACYILASSEREAGSMSEHGVSRRYFFFGTLLAGAVPSGGFGSVPSLPTLGHKPFREKLNVAAVGCGGQGGADLVAASRTENIVALCDVDENRAAQNYTRFDKA